MLKEWASFAKHPQRVSFAREWSSSNNLTFILKSSYYCCYNKEALIKSQLKLSLTPKKDLKKFLKRFANTWLSWLDWPSFETGSRYFEGMAVIRKTSSKSFFHQGMIIFQPYYLQLIIGGLNRKSQLKMSLTPKNDLKKFLKDLQIPHIAD